MKEGEQSEIRVIFATEALGMGADFRDVRRTINWAIPTGEHPATQLQRGGPNAAAVTVTHSTALESWRVSTNTMNSVVGLTSELN
jgi:superfamily II DNA/RNA helicase